MPSNLSTAPQVSNYTVTNRSDAKRAGISNGWHVGSQMDAYNQAGMAQYNNDYNYWLLQQQLEWNSPVNQRKRLEEAGLNPNYNSIDGTGNFGSLPASSGNMSPIFARDQQQTMANSINAVNSIFQNIGNTLDSLDKYSEMPRLGAMRAYKRALADVALNRANSSRLSLAEQALDVGLKQFLYGWDEETRSISSDSPYIRNYQLGMDYKQRQNDILDLEKALKAFERDSENPQKLENLKAQWKYVTSGTDLRDIEINWKNSKEFTGILAPLLRILVTAFGR